MDEEISDYDRENRPGVGVDSAGHAVIDPTKNVLDLVLAAVTRLNDLRAADTRHFDDLRKVDTERQDELRGALDRRLTDLNKQRDVYEVRIAEIKRDYEKQNEEVKSDFGKQIAAILQAQADKNALLLSSGVDKLGASTSDRLALVEKNQYVSGGTASIRDPATDRQLTDIMATMRELKEGGRERKGSGEGQENLIKLVFAAAVASGAVVAVIEFLMRH
jgi:hypothetical protein